MSDAINPQHYKRLPVEAIDIIEAAIENAPSNEDAFLHGQVLKYILRCWNKNGIEDLRKAKWYLNRLIDSFDESEAEQLATGEGTGEVTGEVKHPLGCPDGWRWVEVGETLRRGDTTNTIDEIPETCIDTKCVVKHFALRRNKFEVGEKVVDCRSGVVFTVQHFNKTRQIVFVDGVPDGIKSKHFAPYIEESK